MNLADYYLWISGYKPDHRPSVGELLAYLMGSRKPATLELIEQ